MSDLLTHWAVFDDCRRLCSAHEGIDRLFTDIIQEQREFARLGAITRGGGRWVPEILTGARDVLPSDPSNHRLRRKLAFALGGITHFACDVVMKPLLSKHGNADWNDAHHSLQGRTGSQGPQDTGSVDQVSAYYDIHVLRKVYVSGHEEPFTRFLAAENPTEPGRALEPFVRALFQRALLSCHTLGAPRDNVDKWLDALFDKIQPLYVNIDLYTQVFASPDPEKMKEYAVETEFYLDGDPAILAARAMQRGDQIAPDELEKALKPGTNQSGYGRVLELEMETMANASAFWRGEVNEPPSLRQSSLH